MSASIRFNFVLLFAVVGPAVMAWAVEATPPMPAPSFEVVTESEAVSRTFGTLMVCPAHAHGTPAQAANKLEVLLRRRNTEDQTATVWVCRDHQEDTVKRFGPLVDRIILNPFLRDYDPPPGNVVTWGRSDHVMLKGLRTLRALAPDTQLIACINVSGEPGLFDKRAPSVDEIEWQTLAACGANFQGIVWRGSSGNANADATRGVARLSRQLHDSAPGLAFARPVDWVHGQAGLPLSSLRTNNNLFVVLLNPSYMNLTEEEGNKSIKLPLDAVERRGELTLNPPAGLSIGTARTLGGRRLAVTPHESSWRVHYSFEGGGEMMIFDLAGSSNTDFANGPRPIRFRTPVTRPAAADVPVRAPTLLPELLVPAD